ncbi:MAG: hypothetical protein K2I37_05320 [Muribaculaceae bacterium]|nr:hypothetical protein [Muribaculaceae bacterium]
MRRTPTEAELEYIPNVTFKRNAICQNYMQYGMDGDIQDYLAEQLDANPKLLAWLFDDASLIGKSHLALDCGRFEAFQDFYNSLSIYGD